MAAGVLQYALSLNTGAFTGPMKMANNAVGSLGSAVGKTAGLVLKLGTGLSALAGGVGILSALSKAADMETLNVSMEVLIGNSEEATRVLKELTQFAGATPFNTREVMEAGKNLIALGSSTETLTDELRALGDVSAGMNIPLREMVEIYGKARTQGTLFAEDLNQLAGRGVPIFQELARILNVSQGEVKKLASEGQITFPMLQKVFSDLTAEGGKFYDMMAKQSGTTKGLLSTLKSELDNLLVAIGTPINDFLKPIIASNIGRMQALNQRVVAFLELLGKAREEGKLGEFLGAGLKVALIEGLNLFSGGVRGTVAYLAAAIPPIFNAALDILTSDRTQLFFKSLFTGMGMTMQSQIMDAIALLPGMGEIAARAEAARDGANMNFKLASRALQTADFEGTIAKIGESLAEANAAGVAAFKDATATPMIDPSIGRDAFKELAGALDPAALDKLLNPSVEAVAKSVETLEQALGGLEVGIKKATPAPAKPEEKKPTPIPLAKAVAVADGIDMPNGRRRGLLNVADSARARLARGGSLGLADALGLRNNSRGRLINPARAAEQLARGNAAAAPGRVRREARAEAARQAADPLFRIVKSIEAKFDNLVTA